jgi:hypothetical protein
MPGCDGHCDAAAQVMTADRRAQQLRLIKNPELRGRVIERIINGSAPDQTGNRMIHEDAPLSVSPSVAAEVRDLARALFRLRDFAPVMRISPSVSPLASTTTMHCGWQIYSAFATAAASMAKTPARQNAALSHERHHRAPFTLRKVE